jgi:hypothetical protein
MKASVRGISSIGTPTSFLSPTSSSDGPSLDTLPDCSLQVL